MSSRQQQRQNTNIQPTQIIHRIPPDRPRRFGRPVRASTEDSYHDSSSEESDADAENSSQHPKISTREKKGIIYDGMIPAKRQHAVKLPVHDSISALALTLVRRNRMDYPDLLRDLGYTATIDAAFNASRRADHPFFNGNHHKMNKNLFWRRTGINILCSTPRAILEAVLNGSLPTKVQSEQRRVTSISSYFQSSEGDATDHEWAARAQSTFAPAIYVRFHVDRDGYGQTPQQMRTVIGDLRGYVSGDPKYHAVNSTIDSQTRGRSDESSIAAGLHIHLSGKQERVTTVLTFCLALEAVLDEHAPDGSMVAEQPWPYPQRYFGYTANLIVRLESHRKGNTNFLSALWNDVCKYRFRSESGAPLFSFHTYVVSYLVSHDECRLGEELLTRIGSGYHYTGMGFNIAPAGVSVSSGNLDNEPLKQASDTWQRCLQFRERDDGFKRQVEEELDSSLESYQDHLNSLKPTTRVDEDLNERLEAKKLKVLQLEVALDDMETEALQDNQLHMDLRMLKREHTTVEVLMNGQWPEMRQAFRAKFDNDTAALSDQLDHIFPPRSESSICRAQQSTSTEL